MFSIKNTRDFFCGLLLLAVGIIVISDSAKRSFGTAGNIGPAYFPFLLGLVLTILAIVILFFSLKTEQIVRMEKIGLKNLVLILGGAILFAALLLPAGLPIATIVMILVASRADRSLSMIQVLSTAAVLAVGSVLIFVTLLGQPIPILGSWFAL